MPFEPGEDVELSFTSGNPDTARLEFLGQAYTVENHGLEPKRKGILLGRVRVPRQPGKYPYRFADGEQVESGNLRVQGATRPARPREALGTETPAPLKYRGPGSGVR